MLSLTISNGNVPLKVSQGGDKIRGVHVGLSTETPQPIALGIELSMEQVFMLHNFLQSTLDAWAIERSGK